MSWSSCIGLIVTAWCSLGQWPLHKVTQVYIGLGCIKCPTFRKMLSIAPVTITYLLHAYPKTTMPILKCIRGHLGGRHPPWSLQNFLSLNITAKTSKLSNRVHRMLILKLLTRQRYFTSAKMVCFWYFQNYSWNEITETAILFLSDFYKILEIEYYQYHKDIFFIFFQWPPNEHTMSSVRQFWIFDLTLGVADPLGAGWGGQNSKESRHIWSSCFWHGRPPYICLPACTAIKSFFGTLSIFWLILVDDVCFEADADPLGCIRCRLHFAQHHRPFKGTA